jgi:hypothetical protein
MLASKVICDDTYFNTGHLPASHNGSVVPLLHAVSAGWPIVGSVTQRAACPHLQTAKAARPIPSTAITHSAIPIPYAAIARWPIVAWVSYTLKLG